MKLTKEIWKVLQDTNSQVNSEIKYTPDQEHYGVPDKWVINPVDKREDCDGYSVTKQYRLREQYNIPSYLATCWTETGGYHLVLIIKTDKGDFVLDNRYKDVIGYDTLPYKWDKIEGDNGVWYEIL